MFPKSSAWNYWEKEHHGFAANGASSLLLRQLPTPTCTTRDDAFYSAVGLRNFYDQRWIEALATDEKDCIEQNPEVNRLLAANGASMTPEGLRIGSSAKPDAADRLSFKSLFKSLAKVRIRSPEARFKGPKSRATLREANSFGSAQLDRYNIGDLQQQRV